MKMEERRQPLVPNLFLNKTFKTSLPLFIVCFIKLHFCEKVSGEKGAENISSNAGFDNSGKLRGQKNQNVIDDLKINNNNNTRLICN